MYRGGWLLTTPEEDFEHASVIGVAYNNGVPPEPTTDTVGGGDVFLYKGGIQGGVQVKVQL